ncbi:response regulator transcription factor [Pseudoxanthomonas suwonensis]|uniref:response regulator transcription factor n=1 Tax=Pseudoxanthomonas suwonensis TaxID=314722 RepID=UPI00048CA062|nr:LuxR C-terminal-related transcriptional regulator [Pseudoxanthomonas suwonensis]
MLSETRDEAATIELLRSVARCAQAGFQSERCGECTLRRTWRRPPLPLSPRETEIFVRIGAGEGPQRIASEFGLSVKTVECHREKIKHKLGLQDGEALRVAALRWREGYRLA